jgi:flagellar hook-associated protein 2
MSSPITFSGFNNIDFNVVLNAIMQQASQPLTALQGRQTALKSQATTYSTLSTRLLALQSAAEDLASAGGLSGHKGTTSDASALGITVGADAEPGHLDVVVQELARAQVTATTSTAPDSTTTVVASGGTLTIGGVAVAIGADVTLQGLADAINGTDGIGVSASVIRTAPGAHRLVLSALESGVANAFTITNALTGGTGVVFADTDTNGVSGDSAADNAVTASDAALLVNNIPVTGASNTFADVVTGVTLTALKKDATATIGVDIDQDSAEFKTRVETFVTTFNDFIKFVNDQRASATSGEAASIGRDPLLRQLRNSLRADLIGAHGTGPFTRLAEVGIEFTTTGTLELDATVFAEAMAGDVDAVKDLFAGTAGVFPAVQDLLESYTDVAGFIPSAKDRLTQQAKAMDTQIANLQSRLAVQRESLLRQFIEADQIMSRLKNQSGSLANLGGGLTI